MHIDPCPILRHWARFYLSAGEKRIINCTKLHQNIQNGATHLGELGCILINRVTLFNGTFGKTIEYRISFRCKQEKSQLYCFNPLNVNIKTLPFIHLSLPLYSVLNWPSRRRRDK